MLRILSVRNFAVVSELRLELAQGLNVLTGQTGAGKSVLIEALGFLLGERGSTDWLREGAQRLEVTGTFDAADLDREFQARFKVTEPLVTVRRELDSSGRTRAYVHNQSVPRTLLSAWGDALLDFHGQHEHQTLLKPDIQLELLDAFGGLTGPRAGAAEAYGAWSRLASERRSLDLSEEERLKRLDLCRYQIADISEVEPRPGEEEELEAALPRLKNAERLATLSGQAHELLYDQEGSAQEVLLKAERQLEELAKIDPGMEPDARALAQARGVVQEVSARLSSYRDGADASPERLDEMLTRLDRIGRLKKKYGPGVEEALAARERLRTELSWLENSDRKAEEVEAALAEAEKRLAALASELHEARMKAGAKLSGRVARELKALGMPAARFSISVEMEEGRWSPTGADRAEFLIAPNPGEPLKPLRSVASGGELSRVMLALKTVLAKADRVPILVFDEVDSGVGGETGRAVGRRLADLGRGRQVLCVTHLPQVASFAARHFHISKRAEGGRTHVTAELLDGNGRVDALARMLGGREATEASRRHAQELLEDCRA